MSRRKKLEPLTRKQKEMFDFLCQYSQRHKNGPTIREIAKGLHLSSSSNVFRYLTVLEEKNYIRRKANCARFIQIIAPFPYSQRLCHVPVRAILSNGTITLIENSTQLEPLPELLDLGDDSFFFVIVAENTSTPSGMLFHGTKILFQETRNISAGKTVLVFETPQTLYLAECSQVQNDSVSLYRHGEPNVLSTVPIEKIMGVAIVGFKGIYD